MMSSAGKPSCLGEQLIGALAHGHAPFQGIGLALLVEGHDHHRGAVAARELAPGCRKDLLAFLEADGVDHAFALHALAGPPR